ncbi:MAG: ribosome biogenesis GTPase YlqF [Planctomycetota bacterium]|nr:ribosome biogenesis GTPase YlqF [Planctomycetota bacterium]
MPIQWFPGHMHKAQLEIRASMPKTDVVIEVLDARIPYSSQNPLLAELRGNKPCLKVLAKSDLADESLTLEWQEYLEQSAGVRARIVTTEDTSTIRSLKYAAARMVPHREGKMVNALIVGIPNVGKSTLINVLAGKKLAKTGNVPAITKQQQRINIGDGVMLCDTPGILWHKVHNANSGYRLALVGSIQETAMDYGEVGFFGARYLAMSYADRLQKRYDLDILPKTEMELVEAIGRKRGCISKNQIVDLDRASRILIADLRTGLLGRLTLETPSMMEQEIKKTAEEILEKAESEKAQAELKKKRFKDKQRPQQQARENRNHQG